MVKIISFSNPEMITLSEFDKKKPEIGDIATIVEIYTKPTIGYELECSDQLFIICRESMGSIKVMPEYGCHPLWHHDSDQVGEINPSELPISASLISRLTQWASEYDATLNQEYPPESCFSSKEEEVKFVAKGFKLAKLLNEELNNVPVVYYDIAQQREGSIS